MAMVSQFEALSLTEKSAVSLDNVEEDYILDIAAQRFVTKKLQQTCMEI